MYIAPTSRPADPAFARRIIEGSPFALVVTGHGGLQGTHLPVLGEWDGDGQLVRLVSHMARVNPQWRGFEGDGEGAAGEGVGREALCVFSGAHAYVSPRWYRATGSGAVAGAASTVPTWNYASVHVLGRVELLDAAATRAHVIALTERFEGAGTLDMATVDRLVPAIVGFAITPVRVDAAAKMSMNKDAASFVGVIAGLEARGEGDDHRVAAMMRGLRGMGGDEEARAEK
ncbi:MAG: FMN-binding negative transcriptional regulator [Phycisphaerales bacterium]